MEEIGPLVPGGKVGENTWNSRLAETLRKKGFPSAQFEPLLKIRSGGRILDRKPDVGMNEGGHHFISGKLGERREFEAYRSADEYKTIFERLEDLGEVFAVTYPVSKTERFHLHVLPRTGREVELAFTLENLDEVATRIGEVIRGQITEAERFLEPASDEAPRLLRNAALELSEAIRGINNEDLEAVFGGHDFFRSVLAASLPKNQKKETLKLGASFLFVNQSLFYVLLSNSSEISGATRVYPRILPGDADSPALLWDRYFSKVREVDYEPIYGIDVSSFFKGERARIACGGIVRALLGMAPKLEPHDIAGQVFQTLIPLEIRKPLGANYTNPRAAALLATLAIDDPEAKIMDPACGSGTLLVASYLRKKDLSRSKNEESLHKKFVEKQIVGIDAMAFAGHLAAVNLALQQPLFATDHVQIGTTDSTLLHLGDEVPTTGEALPAEFQQAKLTGDFGPARKSTRNRVVGLRRGAARSFKVGYQDVVIMNPPFTSRDNMASEYRNRLARRFYSGKYGRATEGKKISQQVYFILLADEFLRDGGRIASVIPQITLGGKDYWPVVEFLLTYYSIKYIVVGLGRSAFSEDTSLSECLIVAEKGVPDKDATFKLVGTIKSPDNWTAQDIQTIVDAARIGENVEGIVVVRELPQSHLSPAGVMLPELILRLLPEYEMASKRVDGVFRKSSIPLVAFKEVRKRGVAYRERVERARHLHELGASALLAVRQEERALKQIDRLVYESHKGGTVTFRDRLGDMKFSFQDLEVCPALRRMSYLQHIDVTNETDFCVSKPSRTLEEVMRRFYSKEDVSRMMKRLKENRMWELCVRENSSRVICASRIDFAAPGTNSICCWSKHPMFNVSHYMAEGFEDERQERLFCLWMNSTLAIIQLLPAAASTRGTWVRLERFAVDRMLIPDFSQLRQNDWIHVDTLWDEVSKMGLVSLREQLELDEGFRARLDDGLLKLLGIQSKEDRLAIGSEMRHGVLVAIDALKRSMSGDRYG